MGRGELKTLTPSTLTTPWTPSMDHPNFFNSFFVLDNFLLWRKSDNVINLKTMKKLTLAIMIERDFPSGRNQSVNNENINLAIIN